MTISSTDTLRVFIAARPNEMAQAELVRAQHELKTRFAPTDLRIKWTDPKTFHITLLFLGNIPKADIPAILQKMKRITQSVPFVQISLNGINLFGKSGALWVGIDPSPALFELQQKLAVALELEPGRFHAHFTLGRIKKGQVNQLLVQRVRKTNIQSIGFDISSVELVQSETLPEGSCHTELGRVLLKSRVL